MPYNKTHDYLLEKNEKATRTNNINRYGYSILFLYRTYGKSMNIRIWLFINSTDYVELVYIYIVY